MPGSIIYRGSSVLTGEPIVSVATDGSRNPKTGDMLQVWIMPAANPHLSARTGCDTSVCGACPRRPSATRDGLAPCYVTTYQAPLAVWRAFERGRYPEVDPAEVGAGRLVRLGAYGDPAAVPTSVWERLLSRAAGWTGYTHAWRYPGVSGELARWTMASCDSEDDARIAQRSGWRTFRAGPGPVGRERVCPASAEAGHKITCEACLYCGGIDGRGTGNVTIREH